MNLQDCVSREDDCEADRNLLQSEYDGCQLSLTRCLSTALQEDPAVAGTLGSTTAVLSLVAAARVIWYQVYGLNGPLFPIDR
jgi:hypothetical protein